MIFSPLDGPVRDKGAGHASHRTAALDSPDALTQQKLTPGPNPSNNQRNRTET